MVNPFREVNWKPGLKERRKFAVSLIVGFPCVAAVLIVAGQLLETGGNFRAALTVGGIGVAIGLILCAVPQIARPFYIGWYAVACVAGFLIGNGVLAAIYVLMFAPVGLAMRVVGRSGLSKGFDRRVSSYWRDAQPRDDPERYFRQY